MKKKYWAWTMVLLVSFAAAGRLAASEEQAEREAVKKAIEQSIGWAIEKDFEAMFRLWADNMCHFWLFSDSIVVGLESWKKYAERWRDPDFRGTRFEFRDLRIVFSRGGEVAWYSCYLDDCYSIKGKEGCLKNVFQTGVLEKRDGRWQHVLMHGSYPVDKIPEIYVRRYYSPLFEKAALPPGENAPIADVFQVMELATGSPMGALWPGFEPAKIPVLVFDGRDTYLFHSPAVPDGFVRAERHPEVFVFKGQHPQALGNSITRMGETWTATSVLSASSRRTGERYELKDLAGIIVHEQFHVFQRARHPRWRPNDGLLLRYPEETAEALFLRRKEKEAFRRAVAAEAITDVAGWAAAALRSREERLAGLPAPFAQYEKELQRTEGLSDYIERIARGRNPLDASEITNGIAPAGVRDLGYVEGRWIAMILDRLRPGWKAALEKDEARFLEDILREVVNGSPGEARTFEAADVGAMKAAAGADFSTWKEKRKADVEGYSARPGTRLEVDASARPLSIRIFDPLDIELLEDGAVFHRTSFAAGNETGSLRIANHPCLTWFDDTLRATRLVVNGLKQAPEILEGEKKLILKVDGISVELPFAAISVKDSIYRVKL
jgi:ketosteroid isomerase-like protein